MSLLNDALRKKRNEQQPPSPLEASALFKSGRGRRSGKRYLAAACAALVFLVSAGTGAWWHWRAGEGALPVVETADAGAAPPAVPDTDETQAGEADTGIPEAASLPAPAAAPLQPVAGAPAEPQMTPIQVPAATPVSKPPQVSAVPQPAAAPSAQRVQRRRTEEKPAPLPEALPPRRIGSEPLYRKALLFQRQGRTAEALAMYREVLKIDPDHFDTRLNLTSIYLQSDQFTQAYALAVDLHRQAPAHPQALLNLAIAQIGCGRTAEALPLLDQAASVPQAPLYTIYFHKGVALRQMGQTEAAFTWYRKAEALNPNDGRLLFNLALAFDQQQDYEQAVAYYLKYLKLAKEDNDAAARKVQARVNALRAEMAGSESGDRRQ